MESYFVGLSRAVDIIEAALIENETQLYTMKGQEMHMIISINWASRR